MKKQILRIISGLFLIAGLAHGQSVTTSVRSSDYGLGEIDFNPGVNVSQFVIYGTGSPYAYSPGATLSTTISGDGTSVNAGGYTPTYFTWEDGASGTTAGTSGSTYNASNLGGVEPLSTAGYGQAYAWSTVSLSLTAPASSFTMDFFVHDYYADANLDVLLNSQTIGTYTNIMSSSGSRNTDFLFDQQVSGVTAGDTLTFTFNGLQNLGSSWANIDIFAASVDLILPTDITDLTPTELTNVAPVPEPATLALASLGGLGLLLLFRRRKN
jgi:hypothetical protein